MYHIAFIVVWLGELTRLNFSALAGVISGQSGSKVIGIVRDLANSASSSSENARLIVLKSLRFSII